MKIQVKGFFLFSLLLFVSTTGTSALGPNQTDTPSTPAAITDKEPQKQDNSAGSTNKPKTLSDQQTEANIEKTKAEARKATIDASKSLIDISTNPKVLAVVLAPLILAGGLISAQFGKNPMVALWRLSAKIKGSYNAQATLEEQLALAAAINKRTDQEQETLNTAEERKAEITAATDRYKQCLTVYPQSGRAIPQGSSVDKECSNVKINPTELQALMLEKERYEQCLRDYPKSGRAVPLTGIAGACSQISNNPAAIQTLANDIRIAEETRTQIAKNESQYLACIPGSGYASVGACAATALPTIANIALTLAAIRKAIHP